jgi:hypothetical protein
MTRLSFLPQLPLVEHPLALFGLLLVTGLIGGELVRRVLFLPRIVGYVLIGLLLGGSGVKLLDAKLVEMMLFGEPELATAVIAPGGGRRGFLRRLLLMLAGQAVVGQLARPRLPALPEGLRFGRRATDEPA